MTKSELKEKLINGSKLKELFDFSNETGIIFYKSSFEISDNIIYIPPMDINTGLVLNDKEINTIIDNSYTGNDLVKECKGQENVAKDLFSLITWEKPNVLDILRGYFWGNEDMFKEIYGISIEFMFMPRELCKKQEGVINMNQKMRKATEESRDDISELDKLLAEVDKIEDGEKWIEAERDTVQQYCEDKNFQMTEDEMETIRSRELEDFFDDWVEDWRKKMKINTNILTAGNMEKELKDFGIKPLSIMKKAIQAKTSVAIPEIKASLHWIYNGSKEWDFFGNNSTDIHDYLF